MAASRQSSFNVSRPSEVLPAMLVLLNSMRVIKSLSKSWRAVSQSGLSWSPLKEYGLN